MTRRPVEAVWMVGPDTRRFANGMFTNNVRDLPVGQVNAHAVVDDRARIGGFLDLVCVDDERFLAILDGISSEAFCARYAKYVVFDDVELEPCQDLVSVRVFGSHVPDAPPAGTVIAEAGGFRYASWGWPGLGVRWVGPEAASDSVVHAFDAGSRTAEASIEDAVRVLAGVPQFPVDTGEKGLPHEMGLRETHLSFEKGCYLGQETINRIDVMGKVRKKLRAVRGSGVTSGAEVSLGNAVMGRVGSAMVDSDGSVVGLAVLKEAAQAPGSEVMVGGQSATVVDLPVPS